MSVLGFLKRLVSRQTVAPSEEFTPMTVQEKHTYYHPCAYELFDLIEEYLRGIRQSVGNSKSVTKEDIAPLRKIIGELGEDTIAALIRATREHKDYDVILALSNFSASSYWDELRLKNEATFHSVMRDQKNGWYYFSEALDRLCLAEPEFASCDFSALDETSRQHAFALLRVIMHFIEYKGTTSPDTSRFLRAHPEMADRVIAFIENRGVGIGSFNIEVFNMAKEAGVRPLDSGVL
jgi:hypothetical protein